MLNQFIKAIIDFFTDENIHNDGDLDFPTTEPIDITASWNIDFKHYDKLADQADGWDYRFIEGYDESEDYI